MSQPSTQSSADAGDRELLRLQEALVGRYSIDRELGRGGMGVVYLAHEIALDRPVALKLLPPAYAAQPQLRERFLREARTAAKLSHPHIVPIHAVDQVEGFVFFAMAFVDGETLGERIRRDGALPHREAAKVMREVSWALAYAHAEGVIHRDVKPDNILLEEGTGRALVTDFGIAHLRHDEGVTEAGQVLGTAEFMSPEQAAGEEVGEASDLYSLGVVGFYALTGKLPFTGDSAAAILAKHLTQEPPAVTSLAPGVLAGVAGAIGRCLKKEPAERFQDGGELAEALSESTEVQRELPVPLRIFVKRVRSLASSGPMILFLWFFIGLAILLAEIQEWPVLVLAILGSSFILPFMALGWDARRLLSDGYGLDDARLALERDGARRTEEIRFEFGRGFTWVDRSLRLAAAGGFGAAGLALVAAVLGFGVEFLDVGVLGWNIGIFSAFGIGFRNKRRRDLIGDSLRWIFDGHLGDLIFKLGGVGVKRGALESGSAHRPTEMAIGIAADELFRDLPKELRRELSGLPETIQALEAGARKLRKEVEELEAALGELGEGGSGEGLEERGKLRSDLEATRDQARERLMDAVSRLEKIRLGLLKLHAGEGDVESLTVELGSADELSRTIERLVEGQTEVGRILDS